jgi:hypothetical protein
MQPTAQAVGGWAKNNASPEGGRKKNALRPRTGNLETNLRMEI